MLKLVLITGIDSEIINTLPPKSILLAIELSPLSLHRVTAYCTSIDIPVIFSSNPYQLFIIACTKRYFIYKANYIL